MLVSSFCDISDFRLRLVRARVSELVEFYLSEFQGKAFIFFQKALVRLLVVKKE